MSTLVSIAAGVWGAHTEVSIGLGAKLPLRMTVLADDNGLVLVSPIAIDDALADELAAVGAVHTIAAPNLLHHAHVASAAARYPTARVLGAPGLAAKRPKLPLQGELGNGALSAQIEMVHVQGADKLSEVVLFHRPSATLVVTDLVFNIHGAKGLSALMLSTLSRALGRVEQSRLCRWLTTDRSEAGRSVEALLALPFERLVMAHGDVVERDAVAQLSAGTWWMQGKTKRPDVSVGPAA